MCFGQTGAGKTYTMTGATESYKQRGIIPRAIQQVLTSQKHSVHVEFVCTLTETLATTQLPLSLHSICLSPSQFFSEVENRENYSFTIRLSYLEIYNETLVDLLSSVRGTRAGPGGLAVVEEAGGGVSVKGLSLHAVHNEEEALNLLFEVKPRYIVNLPCSLTHCCAGCVKY